MAPWQMTPSKISEGMRQFTADNIAIEKKLPELLESHPMQWAGMRDGVFKIASTLDDLIELFGGDGSRLAVKFLDPNPRPLVLATRSVQHGQSV